MSDFLPSYIDREELSQIIELARLESERFGFDPEVAAEKAKAHYIKEEQNRKYRETSYPQDSDGRSIPMAEAKKVIGLSPPRSKTAGQRWRFRRDQVIYAATVLGFSQRFLGDVFDLPRSWVAKGRFDAENRNHVPLFMSR
jgi:hypothetical protein